MATTPKTNRSFWLAKFEANMRRDKLRQDQLRLLGYRVAVVWECETRTPAALQRALRKLLVVRH
jgi:DNA mismatch endonuclease, patch repair protein